METTPVTTVIDDVKDSLALQESSSIAGVRPKSETPSAAERKKSGSSQKAISLNAAKEIAEKMNKVSTVFNTSLSFSVDKATGKSVITVLDKETNEVIRQIPPEEMLRMIGKMRFVMGMLLDVEI